MDLIEESVELMGDYLSNEMLAKIVADLEAVIGVDGLSEDEANFLYELVEPWQVDYSGEATEAVEEEEEEIDLEDVYAQLEAWAEDADEDLNWQESVVDLFKLLELESSAKARREMAEYLGCPARKMADSAQMNQWLYDAILKELAENDCEVPDDWYE